MKNQTTSPTVNGKSRKNLERRMLEMLEMPETLEAYDYFLVYYVLAIDDPYILIPTYDAQLQTYFFVPIKNFLCTRQQLT